MHLENRKSKIENSEWLPDMDSNHDKLLQRQLCYRYTIGQNGAFMLKALSRVSRFVKSLKRCMVTTWDTRWADILTVQRFNDLTIQRN
jgi:hypothetical protein